MVLCIDVGNTQLYGGLFQDGDVVLRFRKVSDMGISSDELGFFLKGVIRENGFDPDMIRRIACCSVVPDMNHALINSCVRYFGKEPFVLKAGVKTGLKIRYKDPSAVGADRIANAIAAVAHYPGENLIIADFGTATTFDVVTADKEYLGGVIVPGMRLSMRALEAHTAKLPKVEITVPDQVCGQTTEQSIQSGLYYGTAGTIREVVRGITAERFGGVRPIVLGTGGFSGLFRETGLFDEILPDLVLEGTYLAQEMNP
ncbi:MAG: type III pantothenate kinase [Spirochaetia bacterium]|nr:type III pantothenate kinase [Spirochaetia bacterium]